VNPMHQHKTPWSRWIKGRMELSWDALALTSFGISGKKPVGIYPISVNHCSWAEASVRMPYLPLAILVKSNESNLLLENGVLLVLCLKALLLLSFWLQSPMGLHFGPHAIRAGQKQIAINNRREVATWLGMQTSAFSWNHKSYLGN